VVRGGGTSNEFCLDAPSDQNTDLQVGLRRSLLLAVVAAGWVLKLADNSIADKKNSVRVLGTKQAAMPTVGAWLIAITGNILFKSAYSAASSFVGDDFRLLHACVSAHTEPL